MSKHSRKRTKRLWLSTLEVERRVLLLTSLITFLVLRALQFLFAGQYPAVYPDSGTYRPEENTWLDFSLVTAQARPTLVTGFFALLPDDPTRVLAQWLISTVAWLILLAGVIRLFRKLWVALLAALAVWTIGLSFYAIQWDSTILSESLSISTLTLGLGFLTWWWHTKRPIWVYLAIIALGLSALNRPNMWIVLVGAFIVVLLVARRLDQKKSSTIVVLVLTLLLLAAGLAQQRINDTNFFGDGGLDRIGWSYASMLSDESPLATSLIPSLIGSGIPSCMIPQEPFTSEDGPVNIIFELQNSCPKGVVWVNKNFLKWYVGFLGVNPARTLAALGDLVGPSSQALPYGLDSKIEPPPTLRDLFNLQGPGAAWALVVVSLTAGLIGIAVVGRRRISAAVIGLLVMEIALIASWAMGALLQVWDLHRTIVTSVVGINVTAVLLVAAVLDAFSREKQ